MEAIFRKIIESLISKKRVLGWVSAVVLVIVAGFMGMKVEEVKQTICDTPTISPAQPAPQVVEPGTK